MMQQPEQTIDEEIGLIVDGLLAEFFPDGLNPSQTDEVTNSGQAYLIPPDVDAN